MVIYIDIFLISFSKILLSLIICVAWRCFSQEKEKVDVSKIIGGLL